MLGSVGVEYCAPLGVCILRVVGDVTVEEVVKVMGAAAAEHPRSRNLWDLTEASFDNWQAGRVDKLVANLRRVAALEPGRRVALVVSRAGQDVCRLVQQKVTDEGLDLHVSDFPSRQPALEWLGVMRLPIGA